MKVMKTPRSINVHITSRCNLKCKYCSDYTNDERNDLPLDNWLDFFDELNRCAVLYVGIGGGEPFLRDDLKELIKGITRNRMRFNIASNGTLISDNMAEFIASTERCDSIQISIDGSSPECHDVFRGDGSFKRAVTGLKYLQRHNISVGVRVTIHRQNVYDLEGIGRFLLEELKLPSFSTNAASYFGRCMTNSEEVQLTIDERSYAMETLLKLNKKYKGRISAVAGPLAEAQTWSKMEQARKNKQKNLSDCGYLRSCGGVFSQMTILSDGVMVPLQSDGTYRTWPYQSGQS